MKHVLQWRWEHGNGESKWYSFEPAFDTKEEAWSHAKPWYGYGPNIFRVIEKSENEINTTKTTT